MSLSISLYKVRVSGPIIPTDKAFKFNGRFGSFCSVGVLNSFSFGNAAGSTHFNGPAPEVTRYGGNVVGTIKLRGPNIRRIVGFRLPRVGGCFRGGIVTGIDNFSISSCTCAYSLLSGRRRINVLRMGMDYPGIRNNKVDFNAGPRYTTRMAETIGTMAAGPIFVGLSPGIASVISVTGTYRRTKTSNVYLVGALLNVHISAGGETTIVTGGVNNFSNSTVFPITIHVICRISGTYGVPIVNYNNISDTSSIVRVVVTNTATIRINTTGLISPCTYGGVVRRLPVRYRGLKVAGLDSVVKIIRW